VGWATQEGAREVKNQRKKKEGKGKKGARGIFQTRPGCKKVQRCQKRSHKVGVAEPGKEGENRKEETERTSQVKGA